MKGEIELGNCYEEAAACLLYLNDPDDGYYLVHGIVHWADGLQTDHAWLEQPDGSIWDPYRDLHGGKTTPIKRRACRHYTKREMVEQISKHKHWGPWD